jgi:hypothetical protein
VPGLDESRLREMLQALVRNLNYRGNINITFPIENPSVTLYSDNKINKLRTHWGMIMLSIITATIILIWPILFFLTKRYEVLFADWPFSRIDPCTGQKLYATISEESWFNKWKQRIEKAVMAKQQMTLTQEDLASPNNEVPQHSGNQFTDGAANLIGAGILVQREVNRQVGWGYDC